MIEGDDVKTGVAIVDVVGPAVADKVVAVFDVAISVTVAFSPVVVFDVYSAVVVVELDAFTH